MQNQASGYSETNYFSKDKTRVRHLGDRKLNCFSKWPLINNLKEDKSSIKPYVKNNDKGIIDRIETIINTGFVNWRARNVLTHLRLTQDSGELAWIEFEPKYKHLWNNDSKLRESKTKSKNLNITGVFLPLKPI